MYLNPRIIALYDEYTHAPLPRRVFLKRLAKLAGGAAGVQHAIHIYNEAAELAWQRTIAFLKDALR